MVKIICRAIDCIFWESGRCSSDKITYDPEEGCVTYAVIDDLIDGDDDWDGDDDNDDNDDDLDDLLDDDLDYDYDDTQPDGGFGNFANHDNDAW